MKKYYYLLTLLALISCSSSNSSEVISKVESISSEVTTSISSNEVSSSLSESSSQSEQTTSQYSDELRKLQKVIIGGTIPYIDEFKDLQYDTGMASDGMTPFLTMYLITSNDLSSKYEKVLLNNEYVFDSVDKQDDGVNWSNYYKDEINIRFAYYESQGDYYFDIYTYLNHPGGGITLPSSFDISLYNTDFSSYEQDKVISKNDISFSCTGFGNYNDVIQIKKATTSEFHNVTPINNIEYIYLEDISELNYVTISAGDNINNLKEVKCYTGNGLYYFENAKFFKIESKNKKLVTVTSINIKTN